MQAFQQIGRQRLGKGCFVGLKRRGYDFRHGLGCHSRPFHCLCRVVHRHQAFVVLGLFPALDRFQIGMCDVQTSVERLGFTEYDILFFSRDICNIFQSFEPYTLNRACFVRKPSGDSVTARSLPHFLEIGEPPLEENVGHGSVNLVNAEDVRAVNISVWEISQELLHRRDVKLLPEQSRTTRAYSRNILQISQTCYSLTAFCCLTLL